MRILIASDLRHVTYRTGTLGTVSEIGVTEAREQLGELVNRAAYNDERIVLTRHGRAVAALISVELLREMEDAEDAADLAAARRAAADPGANIPHAQILADLAADEARSTRSA